MLCFPSFARNIACIAGFALAASCASNPLAPVQAIKDLAPGGQLRAAINVGNPILARRDAAGGEPSGVSVDLARELAKRLGVRVEFTVYTSAGRVVEGATKGEWDIAFNAIDPARARDISYSAPYVMIEGSYLVKADSPLRSNAEVDRTAVKIAVGKASAYDLFLTRELKNATLLRAPTSPEVVDYFLAQKLDVAAGVRQQLQYDAQRLGGLRLLDGHFMVINQAMAMPRGREAGARYLHAFVEEMKASGFVAEALRRHGIEGAAVAPPDAARY